MSVWTDRPEFSAMYPDFALVRDILGGTRALRGDSPTSRMSMQSAIGINLPTRVGSSPWLPRHEGDSDESYSHRWERARSSGTFASTIDDIVGRAFSASLRLGAAPDYLAAIETNADRMGTSLHRFVHAHFARKVAFGGSGILIGMPSKESIPADMLAADGNVPEPVKQRLDIRPYLVAVHRLNVRAWEWRERIGGGRELVYLAVREDDKVRREPDGGFLVYECLKTWSVEGGVVVVREYERNSDAAERKKGEGESPAKESVLDLPCIPFVWDAVDDPETTADPFAVAVPMQELAYLQLAHFRESAEQGVAVLAARAEAPVEEGCDPDDVKKPLTFTVGRCLRTAAAPSEHRLAYVGPSGRGVELGEKSLREIMEEMERLGAKPLVRVAGTETATGKGIDDRARNSLAASWVEGTQDAIEMAFEIADFFARPAVTDPIGQRLPELDVEIPGLAAMSQAESQVRIEELRAGVRDIGLPKRVYVEALVASGYLPEGTQVDDVIVEMDAAAEQDLTRTIAAQANAMRLVRGGQPGSASAAV